MAKLTTNVDSIVKNFLYSNQLSIHYYIQFLSDAMDIAKEIEYDRYPGIKTVILETNEYAEIAMPDDYVDWIKVGCQNGGVITVLTHNNNLSRIRQQDSDGNDIAFSQTESVNDLLEIGFSGIYFHNATNKYGENLGRLYGRGGGNSSASFKEITERQILQLHPSYADGSKIVLEYLSHTSTASEALIPKYAEALVRSYLEYQLADWRGVENKALRKRKEYRNELRLFYARMNKMTKQDVIEVLRNNQKMSIKV